MRYIKVLLLVLVFFVSMLFLFQNQEVLGRDMVLQLNLFFLPPMRPLELPTYFILLAGFLLGALVSMAFFLWDRLSLAASLMKARWKIRNLEKEMAKNATMSSTINFPAGNKFPLKKTEDVKADIIVPDPDKNA
ncbi:MAG: lipopolysaccharide assembly protein LapA domain-containing protein [Betaproteobacteria bacterium]|nr:lipopolysaccharide assembly protein LapA domain-containing protein [Betaproteobacteria bacterium]